MNEQHFMMSTAKNSLALRLDLSGAVIKPMAMASSAHPSHHEKRIRPPPTRTVCSQTYEGAYSPCRQQQHSLPEQTKEPYLHDDLLKYIIPSGTRQSNLSNTCNNPKPRNALPRIKHIRS